MEVTALEVRGMRNLAPASVELDPRLTVVHGPNGAGKTNLLEALYFALTGRSCRTATDREMIGFDTDVARAEATVSSLSGTRSFAAAVARDGSKRLHVDGAAAARRAELGVRPAVSVFMPDRLELIRGGPSGRRAHLDAFATALWPARAEHRRRYGEALAQRNALVARIRAGAAATGALASWDAELAQRAVALTALRRAATERVAAPMTELGAELGLPAALALAYRPQAAGNAEEIVEELARRRDTDLQRGFTTWGAHRDELAVSLGDRLVRRYGSQGEQRTALLALLLAEREVLASDAGAPPLLLLDDVTSELDADRRRLLTERLEGGQALITATEPEHVPGPSAGRLAVAGGVVTAEVAA